MPTSRNDRSRAKRPVRARNKLDLADHLKTALNALYPRHGGQKLVVNAAVAAFLGAPVSRREAAISTVHNLFLQGRETEIDPNTVYKVLSGAEKQA